MVATQTKTTRALSVKRILISQPEPENPRSPYFDLAKRFKVTIDFRQFIHVEEIPSRDFRKSKIDPNHFSAVICTSRNAIDHFFRICQEMRVYMPQSTKYFCTSEAIAVYLQKYTQYRKRKVFYGDGSFESFTRVLKKYRNGEKVLLPCSDIHKPDLPNFLGENGFDFAEAVIYKTVCSDLTDLENLSYDVIVFFSPSGVASLFQNFPDFKQRNTRIAAFGPATTQAVKDAGLSLDIEAPVDGMPSMTMALESYLQQVNNK